VPIYEYKCPQGHVFELFQRMSDPPPEACEICGASPVERVLYPVAVHFKGSGFYSTDYGRGGRKREAASDDGSPPSTSTSKDGGGSDGGAAPEKKKPAEA
jgi:putative FmdB family regulatory protein